VVSGIGRFERYDLTRSGARQLFVMEVSMKRFLVFFLLALFWTLLCIAQDREVRQLFSIGGQHYAFTGSVESWNELQKQIKLNNLLCEIMTDEAKGLHPYQKIKLAKRLAKELEE
jgi:hypothetical protein